MCIYTAYAVYHYTLKEIANHLGIHYATASKAVKKGEKDHKCHSKT
jgi:DNA-binding MarR family transcriptional regulator